MKKTLLWAGIAFVLFISACQNPIGNSDTTSRVAGGGGGG
jgi:hypothetical protein